MNFGKLVQDPHFSGIIFQIERRIHQCDEDAKSANIILTDSAVKSCLQKVLGFAKGKSPTLTTNSEKEKILKALALNLSELGKVLVGTNSKQRNVSKQDWIFSLKAVDDSLKTRREMYGHSRGYLDFLKDFLEEGKIV